MEWLTNIHIENIFHRQTAFQVGQRMRKQYQREYTLPVLTTWSIGSVVTLKRLSRVDLCSQKKIVIHLMIVANLYANSKVWINFCLSFGLMSTICYLLVSWFHNDRLGHLHAKPCEVLHSCDKSDNLSTTENHLFSNLLQLCHDLGSHRFISPSCCCSCHPWDVCVWYGLVLKPCLSSIPCWTHHEN